MASRSIEHLAQDHREVEKVLRELELLLRPQGGALCWSVDKGQAFARILRRFTERVLPHLMKEEHLFYPALEEFLPRDEGPLAVLRGEHEELRAQIYCLRKAVGPLVQGGEQPALELVKEFQQAGLNAVRIFRDHVYKEENILFPMVARRLAPEKDADLFRRMEAITGGYES